MIQKLRWEHVDLDARRAEVARHQDWGASGSGLAPSAVRLLTSLPRDEDNPWVIAGRKPGWHLTRPAAPQLAAHPVDAPDSTTSRIHDLRHSFASRALALGEGLPMIGKLLGHTQVQTTGSLRPSCPRHRQGIRRAHRRQHRPRSRCRGIAQHPRPHRSEWPLSTDPKIQEIRRRQNRNIVKRRHLQEVPIARDQTIRFSHQRRLEQLVIIRIATSELRASDRNPFRDRFELSQIDRSDFPGRRIGRTSGDGNGFEAPRTSRRKTAAHRSRTAPHPQPFGAARPGEAPR